MKQVIPHLLVNSVTDNVEFYKNILGFEPAYIQKEDNTENFAIFRNGNVQIMVGQKEQFKNFFPESDDVKLQNSSLLYFEMNDVDSYYEKVKDKVEIVRELKNTWYKTREFWIKDCNGYLLAFFQNI
jgi:uncharacterized glyoxalase superfamily protein PhnB